MADQQANGKKDSILFSHTKTEYMADQHVTHKKKTRSYLVILNQIHGGSTSDQ